MINKIIRYFKGTIRFRVTNGFGERLLNLITENNIYIWDIDKTEEGFIATIKASAYSKVLSYAQKCNVDVEIVYKKGVLFKIFSYRYRVGLVIGFVASLVFLIGMQNIVWEIEVVGNEKVSTSTILRELEQLGVHQFALIQGIDFQNKKQEALLNLPQLSWLTINRDGCKLTVIVSERHIAPEMEKSYPCDIVALKTGLILFMEVYTGEPLVEVGHTVREGEKLVSGVLESERLDIVNKVHSNAKIIAQVQFDKTLGIDVTHLAKEYTGEVNTYQYITLLDWFEIPLFIANKQTSTYDITTCHEYFEFFSMKLPIGIRTSTYSYYNEGVKDMTVDTARDILEESFLLYEKTELQDFAILDRAVTSWEEDGVVYMKIDYVAEQDIAKKVELFN